MFENPLNSDITWLEGPRTTTRNVTDKDPGIVILHPLTEFLRAMNQPTINYPETHLVFSFEKSPLLAKVDAQDILDIALHSGDI